MAIKTQTLLMTYYYIALFSTILFMLKLILFNFVGGDSEVFTDFNTEFDTDPSFSFISVQSVLAFLMGFGWMGYAGLHQFGMKALPSLAAAFGVGLAFMLVVSVIMSNIKKLEENVVKDKTSLVEHKGKAYTSFAPNGKGQIEIDFNGQLKVLDAQNMSEVEIKSFDLIVVKKVEDEILYIEKAQN